MHACFLLMCDMRFHALSALSFSAHGVVGELREMQPPGAMGVEEKQYGIFTLSSLSLSGELS